MGFLFFSSKVQRFYVKSYEENRYDHPVFAQSINAQLAWKQMPLTGLRKSKSVRALSHTRVIENKAERKSRQTARGVMSLLTAVHWLLLLLV